MKTIRLSGIAVIMLTCAIWFTMSNSSGSTGAKWQGVDTTVVERFAEQAGRPVKEPLISSPSGDLLLFVFITAGAIGGFVAGYYFRHLFPPNQIRGKKDINRA